MVSSIHFNGLEWLNILLRSSTTPNEPFLARMGNWPTAGHGKPSCDDEFAILAASIDAVATVARHREKKVRQPWLRAGDRFFSRCQDVGLSMKLRDRLLLLNWT